MKIIILIGITLFIAEALFIIRCIRFLQHEKAFKNRLKANYEQAVTDSERQFYKRLMDIDYSTSVKSAMLTFILCSASVFISAIAIYISTQLI